MKSDVYLVKVTSTKLEDRIAALKTLLSAVGPQLVYKENELVPVKITIGDAPCVYHCPPALIKLIISQIAQQGAKPFLFDTSVIYQGQRQNAVDHLNLAHSKGFSHAAVGAPFIVADGLLGNDGRELLIDSAVIKKIKVPSFVGMLESLVVVSHATGHIVSGYAGALKNVAMGMACRPTKQVQHSSLKPRVIEKQCTACGCCIKICPVSAISFQNKKAFIDPTICVGCGECLCACKFDAIMLNWQEDPKVFCRRMVEVAQSILAKFPRRFYFTFAFDITKECDCISTKDEKMIAEPIGILASSDIVSIDATTTAMAEAGGKSAFLTGVKVVYGPMLAYAAEKGMGNLEYNLITL